MTKASKKKIFALIRKVRNGKPLSEREREIELPKGILEDFYNALPAKDKIIADLNVQLAKARFDKLITTVSTNSTKAFADFYKERFEHYKKQAEPFIQGRTMPKKSEALNEFMAWKEGKVARIQKHKAAGRGWKKIVFQWMVDDGLSIKQTAAYKYLTKYF